MIRLLTTNSGFSRLEKMSAALQYPQPVTPFHMAKGSSYSPANLAILEKQVPNRAYKVHLVKWRTAAERYEAKRLQQST